MSNICTRNIVTLDRITTLFSIYKNKMKNILNELIFLN